MAIEMEARPPAVADPGPFEWMVPPGTVVAHAYAGGVQSLPAFPLWGWSVCREQPWTLLLVLPEAGDTRCQGCLMLLGYGE